VCTPMARPDLSNTYQWTVMITHPFQQLTLVELHPTRNANSCANSSPNPSISPFTNGSSRLMAAPLNIDHTVGGWYIMTGCCSPLLLDDDCGGLEEGGERDEYGSESEGMVRPEAERSREGEGERSAMAS
jgi:hypothetical protein